MIWSYLKTAYRSLQKNRLVSFINVFGLGLSMSVGMMESEKIKPMILLYIIPVNLKCFIGNRKRPDNSTENYDIRYYKQGFP
ncbi:MAG: hypothetical protein ACHQD7_09795 [Chitinophagales bacterium]